MFYFVFAICFLMYSENRSLTPSVMWEKLQECFVKPQKCFMHLKTPFLFYLFSTKAFKRLTGCCWLSQKEPLQHFNLKLWPSVHWVMELSVAVISKVENGLTDLENKRDTGSINSRSGEG